MTGEKIEPAVLVVEGEILPTPAGAARRDKARSGASRSNPKHKNVVWLASARVIDLTAYQRLRDEGLGAKRIGRALGTTMATAQKLMNGVHWQQNPERVRLFNKMKGGSLDPETGQPTAADLAKFGAVYSGHVAGHDSQGEKDLRQLVESAGVSSSNVDQATRRLRLLSGAAKEGDLPGKVDTKWLQDSIDQTLGTIMTLFDPVTLAGASVADLTRAANMMFEKRALLRGEPTAIVRNEQRGSLDAVAAILLKEAQRRGIDLSMLIDLKKGAGGYQEVQT